MIIRRTPMLPATFAAAAARFPDRIAVERIQADGVSTTTYRELRGRAEAWSGWLGAGGLSRGDRVAILADNDAGWIAAYLGIWHAGGVVVPLDTAYAAPQVRTVLASCGARWLFTTPRYLDTARL